MYMERNEAPALPSERDQRTEADERTRREIGSRAISDQRPNCGHELDLPPPRQGGAESVSSSVVERVDQKRKAPSSRRDRNRRSPVEGGPARMAEIATKRNVNRVEEQSLKLLNSLGKS
jgi:hypothetical protein